MSVYLPKHQLAIALIHPQIAPNTGNIARLCVATGTQLHLVRPLGFILSDTKLRRSAMDYWPRLKLTVHDDIASFLQATQDHQLWFFENDKGKSMWEIQFTPTDILIFGSEGNGIPQELLDNHPTQTLSIPQAKGERCLNVSTAASAALFNALREI